MKLSSLLRWLVRAYHAEIAFRSAKGASLSALRDGLVVQLNEINDQSYQDSVLDRISSAYIKSKSELINAPEPYQPGSKWKPQIEQKRHEYIQALSQKNLPTLKRLFENFFRNSGAVSILKKNLYPQLTANPPFGGIAKKEFIVGVLQDIQVWQKYFQKEELSDLQIPSIGNPFGYKVDGIIVTGSSASLNYYAKQSASLISTLSAPIVAEIGSGFGGLFYYLINEHPNVVCLDFDLLEVLAIAQYFLMMAFPQKRFLLFGEPGSEGKLTSRIINDYDALLLPNFKLLDLDDNTIDLFLNIHSLSEMDENTIDEYIKQITRVTRGYFYHENSIFSKSIGYGKTEVPATDYPISQKSFTLRYQKNALWAEQRYMEFLYRKN